MHKGKKDFHTDRLFVIFIPFDEFSFHFNLPAFFDFIFGWNSIKIDSKLEHFDFFTQKRQSNS